MHPKKPHRHHTHTSRLCWRTAHPPTQLDEDKIGSVTTGHALSLAAVEHEEQAVFRCMSCRHCSSRDRRQHLADCSPLQRSPAVPLAKLPELHHRPCAVRPSRTRSVSRQLAAVGLHNTDNRNVGKTRGARVPWP
jgi:hypothetical protein